MTQMRMPSPPVFGLALAAVLVTVAYVDSRPAPIPDPDPVAMLQGEPYSDSSAVAFDWENASPREGDVYVWTDVSVGSDHVSHETGVSSATLSAEGGERVCIAVSVKRGDKLSEEVRACVDVPVLKSPVTITIGTWGNFGLVEDRAGESLVSQYERDHPNVDIQVVAGYYNEQHVSLRAELLAGDGAPTIAAIDEGFITEFLANPDDFVNLLDFGAGQYEDEYPSWRWDQATTPDGTATIGVPYDLGGFALCYRSDLLEDAGMASGRAAVSAAVGDSWEDFTAFAEDYQHRTGDPFLDNATSMLEPILAQQGLSYYDANGDLDIEAAKPAVETVLDAIDRGISANIAQWTPEWNDGFSHGDFAAVLCPAWLMGYIQAQVPDSFTGQWDIADLPGPGGNWGGSFLAIPNQSTEYEQQAAYEFIEWLAQPEQQLKVMEETGNLPARLDILESDAVNLFTQSFFDDAPYGEIFAKTVLDLDTTTRYWPNNGAVRQAVEAVLNDAQSGVRVPETVWQFVVEAAQEADA